MTTDHVDGDVRRPVPLAAPSSPAGGDPDHPSPVDRRPAAWIPPRRTVRPLLMRLHFYAGIFVAPLLIVAAITGAIYTVTPQLERIVYAEQLRVPEGERTIPVAAQIQAARRAYPAGTLSAVETPSGPGATTRVVIDDPAIDDGRQRTVFVDPYTGEIRGSLATSFGGLPLTVWLAGLHKDLRLGEPGRIYSETAASWLWVIVLAGLVLWIGRRRRTRRLRRLVLPDRSGPARARRVSRHAAVGTVLAVGLVGLAATGLTWSKHAGSNFSALRSSLSWTTPSVTAIGADGGGGEHAAHGHGAPTPVGDGGDLRGEQARLVVVDGALATARRAGLQDPMSVSLPSVDGAGYVATESRDQWPMRRDSVAVDPTGRGVTEQMRFADWPVMAQLAGWGVQLHMGNLFDLPNQIGLALLALGLLYLIVAGYRMWWLRRPVGGLAPPPARGAWRRLPRWAWIVVPPVVVVVGWALPLLGISLAAFLVVDAAQGRARQRATR